MLAPAAGLAGSLPARRAFNANVLAADQTDAVVVDLGSSRKGILVGTGRLDRIYVLVPGDSGTFEVALGGVYSSYEFRSPPGQRLDDTARRALLDKGTQLGASDLGTRVHGGQDRTGFSSGAVRIARRGRPTSRRRSGR